MKYIDADRLRAEIERRIKSCDATSKTPNQLLWAELSALLPFLDSLSEEDALPCWKKVHTYTEELHEGDMEKMLLDLSIGKGKRETKIALPDKVVDSISEEPVSEELEEAADKFARFYDQGTCDGIAQECFKAGAEWQYQKDRGEFAKLKAKEWSDGYNEGIVKGKEKMLEDAVDYEIVSNLAAYPIIYYEVKHLGLKDGDKVKIIIIKENE